MIESDRQISAVQREVGTRPLDGGQGRVVSIAQTYPTGAEDLWEACTAPGRLARWFLPVTGDLRQGGRYRLEDGTEGSIETCDPPRGFSATWEVQGEVSRIEVELAPDPSGGTRLRIAHIVSEDEHWDRYGPGAAGVGWDLSLLGLAAHLAGDRAGGGEEWAAGPEGIAFLAEASACWGRADIAAGTDADRARTRAARTGAFYTGGPEE
ncbi:SRPBCC family protein [Nocardiopsis potens]|uniref:SRPBCC family protein n=1 Tax=Nocardiopsis potens TaxID=1246458 RepID=UPI0003483C5D|nr:SRPBCC family protein [Nocardiopsis potens]